MYIIDLYNKYDKNEDVNFIFKMNGIDYCIRKVELNWGRPALPLKVEGDDVTNYKLYESYNEALEFVNELMKLNGR